MRARAGCARSGRVGRSMWRSDTARVSLVGRDGHIVLQRGTMNDHREVSSSVNRY